MSGPGPRPFARTLVLICFAALTCGAAAAERTDSADPCAAIVDAGQSPPPMDEVDESVRADPVAGIASACRARRAASPDMRLRVEARLATALVFASREPDAVAVLDRAIEAGDGGDVDPVVRADLLVVRAQAHRLMREWPSARSDLDRARALQQAAGATRSRLYARTLTGLSSVLEAASKVDDAERAVDEADALLTDLRLGRSRDAVDVLNARTMIAYARQDLPGAMRLAQAADDLLVSIAGPDDIERLEPLATLVAVRSIRADLDGADAAGREALRIGALHPGLGLDARLGVVQNLAVNESLRARPQAALPLAEKALDLSVRHYGAGAPAVLRAHLTLASTYADLNRYSEASRDYDAAVAIMVAHQGATPLLQRLRLRLERAALRFKLGDLDAARDDIAQADDAMRDQPNVTYWRAWRDRLACRIDAVDEDWAAADADCARAQVENGTLFGPGHWLFAELSASRCLAQTFGHLSGDACAQLASRVQGDPPAHPRLRVMAYESLALDAGARGDAEAAYAFRLRALAAAEDMATPDPAWSAEHALARSLAAQGRRPLAILFGKRSIASIERMRASLAADRARFERGFLSNKLAVYRDVADWLLAEGRPAEAVEVLRLLKGEEMTDFIGPPPSRSSATALTSTPREVAMAKRFAPAAEVDAPDAIDADEITRLVRLRDAKRLSDAEQARLVRLLDLAARRESARADELRRLVAEHVPAPADRPVHRAAEGPRRPPAGRADAYLYVSGERLRMVFVSADGTTERSMRIDPARLNRAVADQLAAMSSTRPVDPVGRPAPLYEWLGAPLDEEARAHGVRRIRLWLDGLLRYVPFAALWDGRHYLVERYELTYQVAEPASGGRATASRHAPAPTDPLLAFGVTRSLDGLAALPGVRDELCSIVDGPVAGLDDDGRCAPFGRGTGPFTGEGYANALFTEALLRSRIASGSASGWAPRTTDARRRPVGILHLGTHLSLRPGNLQRSWLLLGDGGHMTLSTLQSLDLTGVGLVVLSACQSGMAGATGDDGREIDGLPTLLHRGGADSVVASLWRVDDRETARLMQTFYRRLSRSATSVPAALRQAQLAMLRGDGGAHAHPYYWAAFVPSAGSD